MDKENQTLLLNDGRVLGFAQYGSAEGRPIFYFTGGNSSRIEGRWFDQAAQQRNVKLLVPDRPGFGLSSFQPNRRFLDWPDDIAQLADSLHIDKFAVFGLSGGSPHVAAVAHKIPDRVTRAAIISGVAPPEMPGRFVGMWLPIRLIFFLARRLPWLNKIVLTQMGSFYANKEQMLKQMMRALPVPDVELIHERPEIIEIFSEAVMEAHRNGIEGDAWEWRLYVRPWGFRLSEISTEIRLWYGQYDQNAPIGMGQYLDQQIPNSQLHVVDDGGHFSTINNHIGAILTYLA
jgi:pimeloyl-ACP methyl ester carboxylesterase